MADSQWADCPLSNDIIRELRRLGASYEHDPTPMTIEGQVIPEAVRTLVRDLRWPTSYQSAVFDGELEWLEPDERPAIVEDGYLQWGVINAAQESGEGVMIDVEDASIDSELEVIVMKARMGGGLDSVRMTLMELLDRLDPINDDADDEDADNEDNDEDDE